MIVAIYGGTFDPVHYAHIEIIRYLSKSYDLVLVVPASQSPFKGNAHADSLDRVNMLKLAVGSLSNIVIDTQEIDRQPPSYTIDTIKTIAAKYPNAKLDLVIGQDVAQAFDKWKDYKELSTLVRLAIIRRELYGLPMLDDLYINGDVDRIEDWHASRLTVSQVCVCDKLDTSNLPQNHIVLDCKMQAISSSVVRVASSLGWDKYFLPNDIGDYIKDRDLYNDYKSFVDILKSPDNKLDTARISHTKRAVLNGIQLAQVCNPNLHKTVIALLMHDIAKNLTIEDLQARQIDTALIQQLPQKIRHSFASRAIAQKLVQDSDILNAIQYHTTGRPGMSLLEKVVYLADATEQGRLLEPFANSVNNKKKLTRLIKTAYSGQIDKAMCLALRDSIDSIKARKLEIHPLTQQAVEYYSQPSLWLR